MPLALEQVFKLSGVPTYTFVKPREYDALRVSLRTPGRGLVIEGPSGIGKTTAIDKVIDELGLETKALRLTPRKKEERELILSLPDQRGLGTIVVDDFHTLNAGEQKRLADFMKVLADEEAADSKLILVGINRAGESLVNLAPDLLTRMDTIRFESNSEEKVEELLTRGEQAFNISINTKKDIVRAASGSFFLAQYLAHSTCLADNLPESPGECKQLQSSLEGIKSSVMDGLDGQFKPDTQRFCLGVRERTAGRSPYLLILKWLAESDDWSIDLEAELTKHPNDRGSVGQIVENGYLARLFEKHKSLSAILHYDPRAKRLTVDDPKYMFYLRNVSWNTFAKNIGFSNITFSTKYDFALSFAGADREIARRLFNEITTEHDLQVFYDHFEQHRIIGTDIEQYLKPIYRSEARFVVCIISNDFPKRVWTRFESEQFRHRMKDGAVIPVVVRGTTLSMFDEMAKYGHLDIDPQMDLDREIARVALLLAAKWKSTCSTPID